MGYVLHNPFLWNIASKFYVLKLFQTTNFIRDIFPDIYIRGKHTSINVHFTDHSINECVVKKPYLRFRYIIFLYNYILKKKFKTRLHEKDSENKNYFSVSRLRIFCSVTIKRVKNREHRRLHVQRLLIIGR